MSDSLSDVEGVWFAGQPTRAKSAVQPLVEGMIPRSGVSLLVGTPGVGKTFVCLELARCIASGKPFLGRLAVPLAGGATVILAGEGADTYPDRIEAAFLGLGPEMRSKVLGLGTGHLPVAVLSVSNLSRQGRFGWCQNKVAEIAGAFSAKGIETRLIIVDTLPASFGFHDENFAASAQEAMVNLAALSTQIGASVVATTHPAKRSGWQPRGSSVFEGAADVILSVQKKARQNGARSLFLRKSRYHAEDTIGHAFELRSVHWADAEFSGLSKSSAHVLGTAGLSEISPAKDQAIALKTRGRDEALFAHAVKELIRTASANGDNSGILAKEPVRAAFKGLFGPDLGRDRKYVERVNKAFQRGEAAALSSGLVRRVGQGASVFYELVPSGQSDHPQDEAVLLEDLL